MLTKFQLERFTYQFITNHYRDIGHYMSTLIALENGCRWIQLRMKDEPTEEIIDMAQHIKQLCYNYEAVFIIDDRVDLAKSIGADGVHLGKNDMSLAEARSILGDKFIIGGTCNTFDDIREAAKYADYVGCGPFRFTETKQNLAPILGFQGYRDIISQCRQNGINIPIVAIGGITLDDIFELLNIGASGIAVSSTVLHSKYPANTAQRIYETLIDYKSKKSRKHE